MDKRETLCDYFDEDVIIKWTPTGKLVFGLVIESSENASDSEDEDSDADSDGNRRTAADKWRHLKPGFTKIALYPNGNTAVVNESKVKLYDRSLLNGDVVQRLNPKTKKLMPNSEHGFCKSTKIISTIKLLGTNKVIENVDSNDLEMLCNITEDTICLLDSWLGYVKEINRKITLKCRDGSVLLIDDLDVGEFEDLLTQRDNDDSEFNRDDYYVGQQLYGPKKNLRTGKWISQTKQMKRFMASNSLRNSKINVVVEDVTIDNISINWLCCLSEGLNKNMAQNSETTNSLLINKNNSRKQMRENTSLTGMHPMGDTIRGEAIQRVKCLNHFGKCSLQLGHQCYYTIKPTDSVISYSEWMAKEAVRLSTDQQNEDNIEPEVGTCSQSETERVVKTIESQSSVEMKSKTKTKKTKCNTVSVKRVRKKKLFASHRKSQYNLPIKTSAGSRLPIEIVATNTRVTVVWQSSLIEEDVPSINLYPVHHIDNHDFFPGDYVIENKDISENFCYGVVQSCDATSRTAIVKWFSLAADSQSAQFVAQHDVSVYDIKDHPDFSFRSGVCVVRIPSTDEDVIDPASRVGQVLDLTSDGMLSCVWLNGQTSLVWPQQLFIAGDYDSDDLWAESDSEFDYSDYSYYESDRSWQTDNEDKPTDNTNSQKKSKKSLSENRDRNQTLLNLLQSGATQLEDWIKNGTESYRSNCWQNLLKVLKKAETALESSSNNQSLNRLSAKIRELSKKLRLLLPFSQTFGSTDSNSNEVQHKSTDPQNSSSDSEINVDSFTELLDELNIEVLLNETQILSTNGQTVNCHESTERKSNEKVSNSDETETKESFKTNDLIEMNVCEGKGNLIFLESVPECHKYFNSFIEPKNPKEFLKRSRFEVSLLKNSLPEGIDVAVFDDRIDLLSVLITGPKGTPYEDGLFVFDIQLPANYPNGPPTVHYISYCSDRLNPNLYESGKVCVSLLGTWSGKGTEVWAPNTSNLLQVIVSIQGLILVPEPYYNEAGYGKQRGTSIASDNSRLYNEMVVIKLIQSMTKMVLNPHKAFEEQIRSHIIGMSDKFIERHKIWAKISEKCFIESIKTPEEMENSELITDYVMPGFPLLPASQGFCLSLKKAIFVFEQTLNSL